MQTLLKHKFGTKAESLLFFKDKVKLSSICRLVVFSVDEWEKDIDNCIDLIKNEFESDKLIIRSSADGEDSEASAMAGYYLSVQDVSSKNSEEIMNAVNQVIDSYGKDNNLKTKQSQVLVQKMLTNVSMSGVIFTQDLTSGAPYYVINYDDESGGTDSITSGNDVSNKTVLIYRKALNMVRSLRIHNLILAVQEVESLCGFDTLDIEFAIDQDEKIYIFQVRPMTTHKNWNRGIALEIEDSIKRIMGFVESRQTPIYGIRGDYSIFGQMPDWNPAEMIGTAPRPLAMSLYRYLITDKTWRSARAEMGYSEPVGAPLMVSLGGQPFIDVRMSFNSFLPAKLNWDVGGKIVNAWLTNLKNNHELHDKIEFDVAMTAYPLNFEDEIKRLMPGILSYDELREYKKSLLELTNGFIAGNVASVDSQLEKIDRLNRIRDNYLESSVSPNLITIQHLLDICINYGTIPFSIIARHAFVGKSLLHSLKSLGVFDDNLINAFYSSIPTVASDLIEDAEEVKAGLLSQKAFVQRYGHLRPGTYDILSLRYDQRQLFVDQKGDYTSFQQDNPAREFEKTFIFSDAKKVEIDKKLQVEGFTVTSEHLLAYIKKAIQGREYAKFVFSKIISDVLEMISLWAAKIGLSRDEVSFLSIWDILSSEVVISGRTLEYDLRTIFRKEANQYEVTKALHLPHLITCSEDIMVVPFLRCRPNYITQQKAKASKVFLDGHNENPPDLQEKIVMIESADPGFDWIFTQKIAGLITKFGGANSHMAIRCAELNIPAAIGCGKQIFNRLIKAQSIEIDCSKEQVEPVWG